MKYYFMSIMMIASFALTVPADAAVKKRKKTPQRTPIATVQKVTPNPHDVYVGNELVGRDPDPSIRAFMRRNPHIWDGPE